jgi:hypothetical protein
MKLKLGENLRVPAVDPVRVRIRSLRNKTRGFFVNRAFDAAEAETHFRFISSTPSLEIFLRYGVSDWYGIHPRSSINAFVSLIIEAEGMVMHDALWVPIVCAAFYPVKLIVYAAVLFLSLISMLYPAICAILESCRNCFEARFSCRRRTT